ncbi:hypothetical protein JB92DRAFT_2796361, partial [Gautieria morchelliformis]
MTRRDTHTKPVGLNLKGSRAPTSMVLFTMSCSHVSSSLSLSAFINASGSIGRGLAVNVNGNHWQ